MKVYFSLCMSNDASECPKVFLNVDKNAEIVIESELNANVRCLALMNVSSRIWSPFSTQMDAYLLVMNSKRCNSRLWI